MLTTRLVLTLDNEQHSYSILWKDNAECFSLQCTSLVHSCNCPMLQCVRGKAKNRLGVVNILGAYKNLSYHL